MNGTQLRIMRPLHYTLNQKKQLKPQPLNPKPEYLLKPKMPLYPTAAINYHCANPNP